MRTEMLEAAEFQLNIIGWISHADVMVVLKGSVDPWQEIVRMADPAYDVQLEFGKLISLYPVAMNRYRDSALPVLVNAREEGILV